MLDEEEFAEVASLYSAAVSGVKRFRAVSGADLKHATVHDLFEPVRQRYLQLTGFRETNENAIMHNRLALYGLPCKRCGKPLRTPKAILCGNCMLPVEPARTSTS